MRWPREVAMHMLSGTSDQELNNHAQKFIHI